MLSFKFPSASETARYSLLFWTIHNTDFSIWNCIRKSAFWWWSCTDSRVPLNTDRQNSKGWGEGALTATSWKHSPGTHFCFLSKSLLGHLWPTAKRSWCNCREQTQHPVYLSRAGFSCKVWQGWKTEIQFSWGREQNITSALNNASWPLGEGGGLRWGYWRPLKLIDAPGLLRPFSVSCHLRKVVASQRACVISAAFH